MTRDCEDSPDHQKVQHSKSDGPGRCECGREKIAIGLNPGSGLYFICPTEKCQEEFDTRFMLM